MKKRHFCLPTTRYEIKGFAYPTIGPNYHVYLSEDFHYYNVPYETGRKKVKLIYSATTVEIYFNKRRIVIHRRGRTKGGYTADKDHMPSAHRYYAEWNQARVSSWAARVGPNVKKHIECVLASKNIWSYE